MINFLMTALFLTLPIHWEPDFSNAKKIAAEKHELILLNFSGSDWCGPCILMRKEYFENPEFEEFSKERLVLVNADFPRRKKNELPEAVVKQNEMLAEMYNKEGLFPLTLLLDDTGKVLKIWRGKPENTPDKWMQEIQTVCNSTK